MSTSTGPPPPPRLSSSQHSNPANGSATRRKHARVASTSEHWNDLPDFSDRSVDGTFSLRSSSGTQTTSAHHRRAASLATPSPQSSPTNGRVLELVREEEDEDGDDSRTFDDKQLLHGSNGDASEAQFIHKHVRGHSRIHERNLSAFFPRPGQAAVGYGDVFQDPHRARDPDTNQVQNVPDATSSPEKQPPARQLGRRGHHHRHSVSHSYFSFLDGPTTDSSRSQLPGNASTRRVESRPTQITHLSAHDKVSLAKRLARLPLRHRFAFVVAILQFIIGSSLWVSGQNRESLAVTSFGYFVVFDGLGGLGAVLIDGTSGVPGMFNIEQSLRRPFGGQRLVTLSHFSQAIYLLFSAVYVCKESVEHVLLLHGANEDEGAHGSGHGGMGHGDAALGNMGQSLNDGVAYPVWLLLLSSALSLIMALAVNTHQYLAQAVSDEPASARTQPLQPAQQKVGNQFSWSAIGLGLFLAMCGLTVPSMHLVPLDKVLALMQSILMFCISGPVAVVTGQILLQTAPDEHSRAFASLQSAFQDLSKPLARSGPANKPSNCVVTLEVAVKDSLSDSDILKLTEEYLA
ncbi:hypothetical protein OIV83_003924 [Microbotryomycetes sp. JL201]|nr:hypothetical protein OIV83_003924 [Microbotryomycetes sp. JL201]